MLFDDYSERICNFKNDMVTYEANSEDVYKQSMYKHFYKIFKTLVFEKKKNTWYLFFII